MSYLFNGTTANLELGSAILSGVPMTFACWFNPANVTSNAMLITLSEKASVGGIDGLRLIAAGTIANDPIRVTAVAAGSAQFADSTTPGFIANKWNHAVGVFASATSRTSFLNGTRATTVTNNIVPTGLDRTNVGSFWDVTNQGFFPGLIAEVGIWNCALTRTEIQALASGTPPSAIRPESLVMYLPLRENTLDYSIFNNFLTNTAAVRNSDHPVMYPPQSYRRKYLVGTAGGNVPTNITLGQASWLWTGGAPSLNAKTMTALAQGAWAWAGQAVTLNAKTMPALAQGAWRWTGQPIGGLVNDAVNYLLGLLGVGL